MMTDLIPICKLTVCFLSLFGLSEFLYYVIKVPVELSRKVSHIGTGFLTMLFPLWLHSHWSVLVMCASFFGLLVASKKLGFLQSINGIQRESYGSASYPVIVYLCFLLYTMLHDNHSDLVGLGWFYLPVLTMALADPAAAFVGSRWPLGKFRIGIDTKSLSGCLAFFSVAFLLAFVWFYPFPIPVLQKLAMFTLIALSGTLAEAFSSKGLDNFTIPAAVAISLFVSMFVLV